MGVFLETNTGFLYAGTARLIDPKSHDSAWAERSVQFNPALKYVLGNYVEADRANFNNQYWTLADLQTAHQTIKNGPLNIGHRRGSIVGHYMDTELLYPIDGDASSADPHPYVEALACFYEYYFPDEYKLVERAYASGSLFFSMECVAKSVTCSGDSGCGTEFDYAGAKSETYCSHINDGLSVKQLNQPHFLGGALIIPPDKPGWGGAEVNDLSALVRESLDDAERIYEFASQEAPHLEITQWEQMMGMILEARKFSMQDRKGLAKKGEAMPDGSFPIANESDLHNAIRAIGRAKDPAAAKAHIKTRAKALGLEKLIPATW